MNETTAAARYKKVLLIEDDEMDIYISNRVIKTANFAKDIVLKTSVNDALDYLGHIINNSGKLPDVIFLDLNFPDKNGFDFLREFKILCANTTAASRIIILTNSLHIGYDENQITIDYPMIHSIREKPLTPETLINI